MHHLRVAGDTPTLVRPRRSSYPDATGPIEFVPRRPPAAARPPGSLPCPSRVCMLKASGRDRGSVGRSPRSSSWGWLRWAAGRRAGVWPARKTCPAGSWTGPARGSRRGGLGRRRGVGTSRDGRARERRRLGPVRAAAALEARGPRDVYSSTIVARARDGRLGWAVTPWPVNPQQAELRIVVGPVVEVRGRVDDQDGRPIAGAEVTPVIVSRTAYHRPGQNYLQFPPSSPDRSTRRPPRTARSRSGASPRTPRCTRTSPPAASASPASPGMRPSP